MTFDARATRSLVASLAWPLGALALLLAANAFFTPGFFTITARDGRLFGIPVDILNHGARVAIVALGMALVIGTGGVDLSVGAVAAIAGSITAVLLGEGAPWPIALAAALGAGALCGLWNGLLVAGLRLQPIIATLILMVAGRGLAQLITGGVIVTFENMSVASLGNGAFLGLPVPVTLLVVAFAFAAFVTRRTRFGVYVESIGDNPAAARRAGVPRAGVTFAAYGACGLLAALCGLIECSYIKAADANNAGNLLELDAILAVVIGGASLTGGRFSLAGAVLGALLMQTLTKTLAMQNVSADIAPAPKAAVVIAVCLLQSPAFRAWFTRRPSPPRSRPLRAARATRAPLWATFAVLGALFLYGSVAYPNFASVSVLRNLVVDGAFLGVAAIGAAVVIISGGIDLSVGAVMALTGVVSGSLIAAGVHPLLAFTIAIAIGVLFGAFQGLLIARFDLPAFMVTLAGMFLARGAAFAVHPQSIGITHPFVAQTLNDRLSIALPLGDHALVIPVTVVILAVTLVGAAVLLRATPFGRRIHALGDDEHAAALMGLHVPRLRIGVYAISGSLSALAGVVLALYQQSGDPASCKGLELDAIAAAVIGGTLLRGGVGTVVGAVAGVLVLGLIQTIITFQGDLSSWWTRIAVGGLVLAFVTLQHSAVTRRHSRT